MSLELKQLAELDFDNIGGWTIEVKTIFAVIVAVIVMVGGYFLLVKDSIEQLQVLNQQEQTLRGDFENKYKMAANLHQYRSQLESMQLQLKEMLKMLPTEREMPGLLDDITFLATNSGLEIQSLDWLAEEPREFYVELPIRMKFTGGYHEFGLFAAGLADLSRIVSLHDFSLAAADKPLDMQVIAKTYRFVEPTDEQAEQETPQ